MAVETSPSVAKRGGGWLLERPGAIFTPEQFDDTTRELVKLTREFVEREVTPLIERMEHGELEHKPGTRLSGKNMGTRCVKRTVTHAVARLSAVGHASPVQATSTTTMEAQLRRAPGA